ncbi:hypothetical protein HDK77DRAFT_481924 [Phyllosticta capitalensis]
MTMVRSGSKHEPDRSPRHKRHGRMDDFAKTHLRGLEIILKVKRESLKAKTRKLVHRRRHKHGQQGVNDSPLGKTNMSTSKDGTTAEHGGASAPKASRPAANGKQFYQHLDTNGPLHTLYEDEIASALRDTSLGCTHDGAPINGNRKLASKLAVDYDYDEQARLADALEASAREKQDHDEEVRAYEMVLRRSVEDQGGVRYHTYEPPSRMGESSSGGGAVVYNPDYDGESSMMGSLRGSIRRRGDDPPPVYTPY